MAAKVIKILLTGTGKPWLFHKKYATGKHGQQQRMEGDTQDHAIYNDINADNV